MRAARRPARLESSQCRRFALVDGEPGGYPGGWPRITRGEQKGKTLAIQQLNPYLNFDGTAERAIALYERALGAKTENLQRFGDVPGQPPAPEAAQRVMHALLRIGSGTVMISDTPPGMPVAVGSNVHVCLDFDEPAEMSQRFDALAAGGQVTMPLQDTFWGARFGMLTDAYGIRWMFNCTLKKG